MIGSHVMIPFFFWISSNTEKAEKCLNLRLVKENLEELPKNCLKNVANGKITAFS